MKLNIPFFISIQTFDLLTKLPGLGPVEVLHLVHVLCQRVICRFHGLVASAHVHAHAPAPEGQLEPLALHEPSESLIGPRQVAEELASPPGERGGVEACQSWLDRAGKGGCSSRRSMVGSWRFCGEDSLARGVAVQGMGRSPRASLQVVLSGRKYSPKPFLLYLESEIRNSN
jgi:hypothetical protein